MRRPRRILLAGLLALAAAAPPGCAAVSLRRAMGRVQDAALELEAALASGGNFRIRDAAAALRSELEAPAIERDAPHSRDPEYQRLLGEAKDTLAAVLEAAQAFDARALEGMRLEVASACRACHERFRRS